MENGILTVENKKDEKFLRRKTEDFDFKKFSRAEITQIINRMKKAMHLAHGIGLSANQIGLPYKMFVAEVPSPDAGKKFYAIFNPVIEKTSGEKIKVEEGCLSVPGMRGYLERHERVVLTGFDKNGKPLKIKAWGLLAHVFQHEVDHLNGKLFIDRTKDIRKYENVRNYEKKQ
jgi:peptide deformylase